MVNTKTFAENLLTPANADDVFDSDLFVLIAYEALPVAILKRAPYYEAGMILFAGFVFLMLSFTGIVPALPGQIVAMVFFASAMGWLIYLHTVKNKALKSYAVPLSKVHHQLGILREQVLQYLEQFDKRTSPYFHCVTQDNISLYFRLRQIETGLVQLNNEIATLLKIPERDSFLRIQELIGQPFKFCDGVRINVGEQHQVRVAELRDAIVDLINPLEERIEMLEKQIQVRAG